MAIAASVLTIAPTTLIPDVLPGGRQPFLTIVDRWINDIHAIY
jgi:hypothetical protein